MTNLAEKIETMALETRNLHRNFGGETGFYTHQSEVCGAPMNFSVYVPPQAKNGPVPVLYYLSGLTCNEEVFMTKAGAQRFAAEHGIMLVNPDTSPRDLGLPEEDDNWDFGSGAGFYIDATKEPWAQNYNMYSYVTEELPRVIAEHFPADMSRQGIFGHSMGGHGALICALKNPGKYKSVSAFAPICAPTQCAWGEKIFSGYLDDRGEWDQWDANELVKTAEERLPLLIDQGAADDFLDQDQLNPALFEETCASVAHPLELRMQDGYDHGYYFISSFIEDHIRHHAKALA